MTAAAPAAEAPTRVDYVALPAGAMVGRYEIASVLGHGGFGITYLARDSQLDREVALKEYLPAALAVRQDGSSVLPRSTEVADDFGWGRGRFIEEGRTLANLHEAPSIVRVFDYLEANGTAYIVMELLRGQTLEDRIKAAGPMAPDGLEAIVWPLLAGLQKVHEVGFLHRDIKPANVMLSANNKATLIDFGASRAAVADRTKTMTAIFTPGYAAPEQFTSARQGPWTDIYGLAATLHYAITGKAPPSAFDRLMEDAYEPLAILQPEGFCRGLLAGIDAGLSIHFEERPQSVAGWRALLRDEPAESAETLVMVPSPPPTRPTRPTPPSPPTVLAAAPRRHGRWVTPAAAAVALLAMAGTYLAFAPAFVSVSAPGPSPTAPADQSSAVPPPSQEAARPSPTSPAETAEAVLKLTMADRQRIQVKLTSLGFDTRGSDGTFGPRSREMIAAWQRARKHPATGYLTAAENQALLREGQPPPPADQKRSEPEMEAAVPLPPTVEPTVAPPVAAPPVVDTFYVGSLSGSATGGGPASLAPLQADLRLVDRQLTGRLVHPVCGTLPVSLTVDAVGAVSGNLRLYEAGGGCAINAASASGRLGGGTLTLDLRSADVGFRGTLPSRTERSPGGPAPRSGLRSDAP
jgi:serine/threonine protein kinase